MKKSATVWKKIITVQQNTSFFGRTTISAATDMTHPVMGGKGLVLNITLIAGENKNFRDATKVSNDIYNIQIIMIQSFNLIHHL